MALCAKNMRKLTYVSMFYVIIIFGLPVYMIYDNSSLFLIYFKQEYSSDLKYLLLWTPTKYIPLGYLGKGQTSFKRNNCTSTNCYVTTKKDFFGGDLLKFHALAFNSRIFSSMEFSELPTQRSPHQKYIFFNCEPSIDNPVCDDWFDGFFNWTATYRLDSDIIYAYIYIRDKHGNHVGPMIDMNWVKNMDEINEELKEKLKSKNKAAAWFVSNCGTRSKREIYVRSLQKAMARDGYAVDIYGECGPLKCAKMNRSICNAMIASEYYFYLSFESAFAEDYVTEKLLTALNNDAVPIVYGGANYTRFLPPGSYIDARAHTPESLAATIADVIATPRKYHDFFRWRNHYSYSEAERVEDVCNVCAALNDETKNRFTYMNFRTWWDPIWKDQC